MSSRAIQRLRQEREEQAALSLDQVDEDDDSEEETGLGRNKPAFLAMMEDSSESEDDEEEEEEEVDPKEEKDDELHDAKKPPTVDNSQNNKEEDQEEEENLDALLAEFESRDEQQKKESPDILQDDNSEPSLLLSNFDMRDLDLEFVMRTSLSEQSRRPTPSASQKAPSFLFGPPRDGWVRPPHLIGGGIGMKTYDDTNEVVPWPYNTTPEQAAEDPNMDDVPRSQLAQRWFTFEYSDTYRNDLQAYRQIENSGDANALALFVAQHPFCIPALLQLTMVLYQTNQSQDGLALLRRALWISECAALVSFRLAIVDGGRGLLGCLMDHDKAENAPFFSALFRLIQVSSIAGCLRTSLVVSRYLLSLDPLRDPQGVLPLLDYFALSTLKDEDNAFLVELVESQHIQIYYRDESTQQVYCGDLLDLPNWSYSYALALHRLSKSCVDGDLLLTRANEALQKAIRTFPTIVEQLLDRNEIDTTGRGFRHDWPLTLNPLRTYTDSMVYEATSRDNTILRHAALAASDLITQIYLARAAKLWSADDVVAWLYDNCANADMVISLTNPAPVVKISPALIRYSKCDPSDYEDRFRQLPPEANPLNPGLVAPALIVDPQHARRFARHNRLHQAQLEQLQQEHALQQQQQQAGLINVGPQQMQMVDPDLPMLEVYWRSLLPWNHVEGVPPPRR